MMTSFVSVLNISITASLIAILFLFIRLFFKKYLPSKYLFILWYFWLFRMATPFAFSSKITAFNFLKDKSVAINNQNKYVVYMEYIAPEHIVAQDNNLIYVLKILTLIWVVVLFILLCKYFYYYFQTKKILETSYIVKNENILFECKKLLNIKKDVVLMKSENIASPMVFGFLKPKIYLPLNYTQFNSDTLKHILLHELTHIKRYDPCVKILSVLLVYLHWFNPLFWFCNKLLIKDMEASVDEKVLSIITETNKKKYMVSLVDMATNYTFNTNYIGAVTFSQNDIEDRVNNIIVYKKLPLAKIIIFTVVTLYIGAFTSLNPVFATVKEYKPKNVYIPLEYKQITENYISDTTDILNNKDILQLANISTTDVNFMLPVYEDMTDIPQNIKNSTVYHNNKNISEWYFLADNTEYVAVINNSSNQYLQQITPKQKYESAMLVNYDNEAVQIVDRLIKFGMGDGFNSVDEIDKKRVCAFCIDVAHERTGDMKFTETTIQNIAYEFFMIENFEYKNRQSYFNNGYYIYDNSREIYLEYSIVDAQFNTNEAIITVEFYKDPLKMQVDKTIKYTLKKI